MAGEDKAPSLQERDIMEWEAMNKMLSMASSGSEAKDFDWLGGIIKIREAMKARARARVKHRKTNQLVMRHRVRILKLRALIA